MAGIWVLTILFVISIIVSVISIISIFAANEKAAPIAGSIVGIIGSFITFFTIEIPPPDIFPLDNELIRYEAVNISLKSDYSLKIYYSQDGTDPKNCEMYADEIKLDSTQTIAARTQFFIFWSDIVKSHYTFADNIYTPVEPTPSNEYVSSIESSSSPMPDSVPAFSPILGEGEREQEENDGTKSANKILVNTKYIGNLETDKDVDFYEFNIEEKGRVNITFEHVKFDSGDRHWEVNLLDGKNDAEIMKLFSNGREASLISHNARIAPGTYYIKINKYYYSNEDYSFVVNFTPEDDFYETEPNNAYIDANQINLNTTYKGNLQTDRDADFFAFNIEEKGRVSITFEHAKFDSGDIYWEVYLLDGKNDSEIIRLFSNGREASLLSHNARIAPGTYYIKINKYYYSNEDYSFHVNYTAENDSYETEPNNAYLDANKIILNKLYTGNLQTDKDVDFYEFIVEEKGEININFEHEKLDSGDRYWEIYVLSSKDDKVVGKLFVRGNEPSLSMSTESLDPGIYYMKINKYYFSNNDYSFIVSR